MEKYQLTFTMEVFADNPTEALVHATERLGFAADTLKKTANRGSSPHVSGFMGRPVVEMPDDATIKHFWKAAYHFHPAEED
jgi:hypothetical protein